MMKFFVLLFCIFATTCLASPCTDACDAAGAASTLYSGRVVWCGVDGITYDTPRGAINDFTQPGCYSKTCGIALLWPGTCGCPNNCFAHVGRGVCSASDNCTCAPGWGGKDCSNVVCPANTCSGHGVCKAQSKKGDICQCANGYTSADCSVPVPSELAEPLPFGQIFPGDYYKNDKYGDNHPILNKSLISSIRLKITPVDLATILDPKNLYNQTDLPAELYLWNGYTDESTSTTVRLHGSLSRVFNKKSYNLKFGKGNSIKKLKGITLKATNFDRIVSFQMMWEFHRAMNSQTYRMAMTELWVNDVFYGMYTMLEKINDDFEEFRFNVSQDTDMFKMAIYDGQDLGDTDVGYKNLTTPIYNTPQPAIDKEEGSDDDWSRFIAFIKGINAPTAAARTSYLNTHFNVQSFLRSLALEAITMQFDGYSGTGNNWIIADSSSNNLPFWEWIAFDFDSPIDGFNLFQDSIATRFGTNAATLNQLIEAGAVTLPPNLKDYFLSQNPYKFIKRADRPKPLTLAVFELANSNKTFTNNIRSFLRAFWVEGAAKLLQRWDAYYNLALTGVYKDVFYTIDGSSVNLFGYSASLTRQLLQTRFSYLQSIFGCANTVRWTQTLVSSWNDGAKNYSQWAVTLNVGAEPLYSTSFSVTPPSGFAVTNIWSAEPVGNGVYTIPSWIYNSGVIAANTNFYSFGYITTGTAQAEIKITNEPCLPPTGCTPNITAVARASWVGDVLYQQYELSAANKSGKKLANFDVKITLAAGSTISSSYGLETASSGVYTCRTYDLESGNTIFPGCGFTVSTPQGNASITYATAALDSAVCL